MSAPSIDLSDKVREILNYSGFPFQHYCADLISKIDGFQLATEVPFTHPQTNGPMLGVHGAMDILAVHPASDGQHLVCFVIECKRANDKTKNWILLANQQQNPRWPTFMFSEKTDPPEMNQRLGVTHSARFPELGYNSGADFEYCTSGVEMNANATRQNLNQKDKIYDSLRQVAHATRAFEVSFPKDVEGIDYFHSHNTYRQCLYIPVVVTTASIYTPTFPVNKVIKGDVMPNGFSLGDARKWVSYELPLPDYLSYRLARDGNSNSISVGKRTVFIVNDESLTEFLSKGLNVISPDGPPN